MKVKAVLTADVSGSMDGDKLSDSKEAMINFTKELPEEAELGIVTFGGGGARVIKEPTSDGGVIKSEVRTLMAIGGTPMHAGLKRSLQLLKKNETSSGASSALTKKGKRKVAVSVNDRKVIVLSSDGLPTLGPKEDGIIKLANEIKGKGVKLFTVAIGEDADKDLLRKIASSEEDFYEAEFSGELPGLYEDIATGITPKEG